MTTQEAKKIDLKQYLFSLGFEPKSIRQNTFWYCSPFRNENTPSFKIQGNLWHDFGSGEGGTIIDFGTKYFQCSISDFLKSLRNKSEMFLSIFSSFPQSETYLGISIQKVKSLQNKALLDYLTTRRIDISIAQKYCQEMYYVANGKRYFGLCFRNDKGGYEIRNKYFKGSTSPKCYTHLKFSQVTLLVLEGFIDFLSALTIYQCLDLPHFDVLVLNSLSLFKQTLPILQNYESVLLLLDTDDSGRKVTEEIKQSNPAKIKDISYFLETYKDVNDYLMNNKNGQRFNQITLSAGRP
jgi:hypothetical protein